MTTDVRHYSLVPRPPSTLEEGLGTRLKALLSEQEIVGMEEEADS